MNEEEPRAAAENINREKPKRKRHRPRTKGYRFQLKNEIEKALCAELSTVGHLFSVDEAGICSADLNEFVTFLGLNTNEFHGLSASALKSISNISSIFRIDGSPSEGLRIFRKAAPKEEPAVVYVDNLPPNCRILYLLQRASMFGTVVSIRPRFVGEKTEKMCYTLLAQNASSASTTKDLLASKQRVESAFIQFVDASSADEFCKAYRRNMPGKPRSPVKRNKSVFLKRKKPIRRAVFNQKSDEASKIISEVKDVLSRSTDKEGEKESNFTPCSELGGKEIAKSRDIIQTSSIKGSQLREGNVRRRKRQSSPPSTFVKRSCFDEEHGSFKREFQKSDNKQFVGSTAERTVSILNSNGQTIEDPNGQHLMSSTDDDLSDAQNLTMSSRELLVETEMIKVNEENIRGTQTLQEKNVVEPSVAIVALSKGRIGLIDASEIGCVKEQCCTSNDGVSDLSLEKIQQHKSLEDVSSYVEAKKEKQKSTSHSPLKKKRQGLKKFFFGLFLLYSSRFGHVRTVREFFKLVFFRIRKRKRRKRKRVIVKRNKIAHVTRYFSKMQVVPLSVFLKLRDEYLALKKASMGKLKRLLKQEKVALNVFGERQSKLKKLRGRRKLVARAAVAHAHWEDKSV